MKKYRIFTPLAVVLLSVLNADGQKKFSEADYLFFNQHYGAALPFYLEQLSTDSGNPDLNYKAGVCYLNSRSQKAKAIGYLEKGVTGPAPVTAYKQLGDAYQLAGKYAVAKESYEIFKKKFQSIRPQDSILIHEVNWKIGLCDLGKKLQASSAGQLCTPTLAPDQSKMTFTFHQPTGSIPQNQEDSKYFMEFYIKAEPVRTAKIDTTTTPNEATVASSADGQIVLTYRNNKGKANLYISRLVGNQWTYPEIVSMPVNQKGWEQDEFLSADGQLLYFTSDRPGGFGGKDIYVCKKSGDGEWGKAVNVGPAINTPSDEEAPFIYSNGRTLFFSSNRNKQKCCFDIFRSTLLVDGTWSEAVNVGYPVKKALDSELAVLTTAYQEYSPAAVQAGDYNADNLYKTTFIDEKKAPFTVLKGKIVDVHGKVPVNVRITVTDNETGEVLALYNSHYKTGDYILPLPSDRNNNITYEAEGYLYQSENVDLSKNDENYRIHKLIQLSPEIPGSITSLGNIFFDYDRSTFMATSHIELHRLFLLLSSNPEMQVAICCTPNPENNKFKMKVAEERAQAIANYLIARGISKNRIAVKAPEKMKPVKISVNAQSKNPENAYRERVELEITDIR